MTYLISSNQSNLVSVRNNKENWKLFICRAIFFKYFIILEIECQCYVLTELSTLKSKVMFIDLMFIIKEINIRTKVLR